MSEFKSLISLLMEKTSTDVAISFYENGKKSEDLTYQNLLERAYKRAEELRAFALSPRSMVLLEGTNNAQFIINFLAIQMIEATPVPVSPGHFISDKRFAQLITSMVKQTGAKLFLTNPVDAQNLEDKNLGLDLIVHDQTSFSKTSIPSLKDIYLPQEDDTAFIQFSSGSTGDPKGVVISHLNLMSNLTQIGLGLGAKDGDQVATWLPVHHDMGLIGCVLFPLFASLPVHVMRPYDFAVNPKRWLKLISDNKISITCAPNSAYHMCTTKIREDRKKDLDLSSLRVALCGAEPINAKTLNNFIEAFREQGLRESVFLPCYGMAENVLAISFTNPENNLKVIHLDKDLMVAKNKVQIVNDGLPFVSCGRPLPGIEVKVLNDKLSQLSEGNIGEIVIKSASTTKGYYKREDVNAKLFVDGFLRTGDLGFIHEGEVYIVGRAKDLIIVNGLNICPEEIEKQVLEVRDVRPGRLAAFAIPNKDQSSEEIQIVLELKGILHSEKKREEIRNRIAEVASQLIAVKSHQISIVPPGTIQKTTSGKIKRSAMKDMFASGKLEKLMGNYGLYTALYFVKTKFYTLKVLLDNFMQARVSSN